MDAKELNRFFDRYHQHAPKGAVVVFTSIDASGKAETINYPAESRDEIIFACQAAELDKADVYHGCCLFPEGFEPKGRGRKPDVRYGLAAYLDIDIREATGKAHKAPPESLPPSVEDAVLSITESGLPEPSILVHSGYGLHAYWCFNQELEFGPSGALSQEGRRFERLLVGLQERLRRHFKTKGWHLDSVADATRILRVPGTLNYKVSGSPMISEVLDDQGPNYALADLEQFSVMPTPVVTLPPLPTVIQPSPSPGPVLLPGDTNGLIRQVLRNMNFKGFDVDYKRQIREALLNGEQLDTQEMDKAMHKAACFFSTIAVNHGVSCEDLSEFARPSMEKWASRPDATKTIEEEMEKMLGKIRAQVEQLREKEAEKRAQNEKLLGGFKFTDPASAPSAPPPDEEPETGLDMYTASELADFARQQNCSIDEFRRRWIVQYQNAFYLYKDGKYIDKAFTTQELETEFATCFNKAPIDLVVPSGKSVRKLRPNEVVARYGTVARELVFDMCAQYSHLDSSGKFTQCTTLPRVTEAKFDGAIDAWLDLLGGTNAAKLKDWIATYTLLHRPTCALYLAGPKNVGKTVLANSLARVWQEGGAIPMEAALADFNDALLRCPLVLADEYIPRIRGKAVTAALRAMLGNAYRDLNRKFLPRAKIHGNMRLILAANNDALLQFNESMTENDLSAVIDRFLYISCDQARGFFDSLPGKRAPDYWVEGDGIAKHALWLRDNRKVELAGRWLVQGTDSIVHDIIATSGNNEHIAEWLAQALAAPKELFKQLEQQKAIVVGDGHFYVNGSAVISCWKWLVKSAPPPRNLSTIGAALSSLSHKDGKRKIGTVRYHDIKWQHVINFADRHDIGDQALLQERINRKLAKEATNEQGS